MLITNRFLDVREFASGDVQDGTRKPIRALSTTPSALRVNVVRLAVAIAKGMHSGPVNRLELAFAVGEQLSALQRYTSSRSAGSPNNLRLSSAYFQGTRGLRDFSRTTTEGQYGQGLAFLFAQDILRTPALVDFDYYCRRNGIPTLPGKNSRPDYIACTSPHRYWIIESKANVNSVSVKPALRDALDQCDAGAAHLIANGYPGPQRSYAVLTQFKLQNSLTDTAISYADPPGPQGSVEFESLEFLRHYYEGICAALGFQGDPESLWRQDARVVFAESREFEGLRYYEINSDDSGGPLFSALQIRPQRAPELFGSYISVDVISTLSQGDIDGYFKVIRRLADKRATIEQSYINSADWIKDEYFADGTVVSTTW